MNHGKVDALAVLEPCHRRLKVPRAGKAIRSNESQIRKPEVARENFEAVAPARAEGHRPESCRSSGRPCDAPMGRFFMMPRSDLLAKLQQQEEEEEEEHQQARPGGAAPALVDGPAAFRSQSPNKSSSQDIE